MNIYFKNELLCFNKFAPFQKFFCIVYPDLVDLDLFKNEWFLIVFKVECNSLAF
jgi:hypothetical protein